MSTDQSSVTLEALAAEVAQLNAANAALQDKVSTLEREREGARAHSSQRTQRQRAERTSRRKLLQLGGAAAAAGVAAAATNLRTGARTAHAVSLTPDTVTTWTTSAFTADAETVVTVDTSTYTPPDILQLKLGTGSPYNGLTGSPPQTALAVYAPSGQYGIYATSQHQRAIQAETDDGDAIAGFANAGTGVSGSSNSGAGLFGGSGSGYGVYGTCYTYGPGVYGNSSFGNGVQGIGSIGGSFNGTLAPLFLQPNPLGNGAPGGGTHVAGEIFLDKNAVVWVCVGGGTPGTWVRLTGVASGASGGAITYLSAPVRLLDARSGASSGLVNRGPLTASEIYALSVAGLAGSNIPAGALGLICNVTVLGPSQNGNLSLFPAGAAIPTTASLTFVAGAFLANHVNAALGSGGDQGKVNIQNQSGGTTPLVVDAVAYVL